MQWKAEIQVGALEEEGNRRLMNETDAAWILFSVIAMQASHDPASSEHFMQ